MEKDAPNPVNQPRALVLRTAGTNCDVETMAAAEKAGFQAELLHVNRLVERPEHLENFHFLLVPGGFSYGDDLGAGTVFGNELQVKLGRELRAFVKRGGLVLGICNGFQILVRAGLLPDPFAHEGASPVTVTFNDSGKFECRWVHLRVASTRSVFLKEEEVIELPIAHAEGKFVARDTAVLDELRERGQLVVQYVGPDGEAGEYPWNPNGSVDHVAGICDPTGRVLGLMPHPERFISRLNHPTWTRRDGEAAPDGLKFFTNAYEHVKSRL